MARQIKCPKCKKTNFTMLDNTKKSMSAGKAVVGGVLFGPLGAGAGAIMGKKGKYDLLCNECGHRWEAKK